jgi:hypothetical protein
METHMRLMFAIIAVLVVAGTSPSMARNYRYCARTTTNPDFGDCSFTSYRQCMATVRGQAGDCIRNPNLVYGNRRNSGWRNDMTTGSSLQGGTVGMGMGGNNASSMSGSNSAPENDIGRTNGGGMGR